MANHKNNILLFYFRYYSPFLLEIICKIKQKSKDHSF